MSTSSLTLGTSARMIDPMQELGRAIDLWMGELARAQKSPRTRARYGWTLQHFADTLPPYTAVSEITADHCRRFLDRWRDSEASTMRNGISALRGFFRFMIDNGHAVEPGPMHNIKSPRRKRAVDLDVITISEEDANKLISACETWQELLCLSTALYTGRRRAALNAALRRDVDLERGTIRFRDKGDKVINQPIPREFAAIVRAADQKGVWLSPSDYLIPSRRPAAVTKKLRKDSLIWDTVKIVAARAGVESHVHALRAAFAVRFDDQHPDRIDTLRELMGHVDIETTLIYLRRKDRARDMETVLDLSWGSAPFLPIEDSPGSNREASEETETPAFAGVSGGIAHTGFEPVLSQNAEGNADGCGEELHGEGEMQSQPLGRSALDLKLAELSAKARRAGRRVR